MPSAIAPIIGWLSGYWLARFTPQAPDLMRASQKIIILFATLVFAPATTMIVLIYPDWAFFYLLDGHRIPSAIHVFGFALNAFVVIIGFYFGKQNNLKPIVKFLTTYFPHGLLALLLFIFWKPIGVYGSFRQVHADFGTTPIFQSNLGIALLWTNAILSLGFIVTHRMIGQLHTTSKTPSLQRPSTLNRLHRTDTPKNI